MNPRLMLMVPEDDERLDDMDDMDLSRFDWGMIGQYKEVLAIVVSVAVLILLTIWRMVVDSRGTRRLSLKLDQGQADQAQRFDWLAENVDGRIDTLTSTVMTTVKSTEHRVMALERRQDIQDRRLDLMKQQNDLNRQMAEFANMRQDVAGRSPGRLATALADFQDDLATASLSPEETQPMPKMNFEEDDLEIMDVEEYTVTDWAADVVKSCGSLKIWKWGFGFIVLLVDIFDEEGNGICDNIAIFISPGAGGVGFVHNDAVATDFGIGIPDCAYDEESLDTLAQLLGEKIEAHHFGNPEEFEVWSQSSSCDHCDKVFEVIKLVCESYGIRT